MHVINVIIVQQVNHEDGTNSKNIHMDVEHDNLKKHNSGGSYIYEFRLVIQNKTCIPLVFRQGTPSYGGYVKK